MSNSLPNKKFEGQKGFPTPNAPPDDTGCRVFQIPADEEWFALFMAAVNTLCDEWRWWNNGTMTPSESVAAWQDIIDAAYAQSLLGTCATEVQTPYWDQASDVEDDAATDMQPWYGQVTNPTDPPGSLDFVENILLWSFTGLVALATPEIGSAPAILFHTIAKKFIIAQKAGDFGEIIRIVVDGQDMATVDTSGRSGEIINTSIVADPTLDSHDILIIGQLA